MAYKEKDTKKWTAQWFETNARGEKKKRRKRGFETKREALEYERQKKLNNSRSMDMKLSEFMEVYFEDKQNELKERTMKNKRYMMEQHIVPYFGNQMMSEITAGQIIQWQNEMQTRLADIYSKLEKQNKAICQREQQLASVEKEIVGTKGIFKGKQRKELQEQAEQLMIQIANMKQYLSSIVQSYGYNNVKEFLAEYHTCKTEYCDYQSAVARWEQQAGNKAESDSLKARLQRKAQEVKERENNRQSQHYRSDRGGR